MKRLFLLILIIAGFGLFYTMSPHHLSAMQMWHRIICHGYSPPGSNLRAESYELKAPTEFRSAKELTSGKTMSLKDPIKVAPRSTVVLYLD